MDIRISVTVMVNNVTVLFHVMKIKVKIGSDRGLIISVGSDGVENS